MRSLEASGLGGRCAIQRMRSKQVIMMAWSGSCLEERMGRHRKGSSMVAHKAAGGECLRVGLRRWPARISRVRSLREALVLERSWQVELTEILKAPLSPASSRYTVVWTHSLTQWLFSWVILSLKGPGTGKTKQEGGEKQGCSAYKTLSSVSSHLIHQTVLPGR